MEIIQGQNQPIYVNVGKERGNIDNFSAVLVFRHNSMTAKHWGNTDVDFDEGSIVLNLKESETLALENGIYTLSMKWVEDGEIIFAKPVDIVVKQWADKTRLTDD